MRTCFFFAIALLSSLIVTIESRAQQGWKVDTVKHNVNGILTAVEFTSTNAGVIVGDTNLSTTDGGKSWKPLGFAIGWQGLEYGFSAIHCFSDLEWVGVGATSFRTTNAGQTWIFDSIHALYAYSTDFMAVDFVGSTGLAVGQNNSIYLSLDRGASWSSVSTYGPSAIRYFALAPAGPSSWVVGGGNILTQNGFIVRSTNNGASWDTVLQTNSRVVTAISFANAAVGYAAADYIYKTTDGGATWKVVDSLQVSVRGMSFTHPLVGTLVGSLGKIYRTIDGGAHWTKQTSNTPLDLWAVCFIDTSTGWAVGYRDIVVHTTNGGWGEIVSVEESATKIPKAYSLLQNFPNPFNPMTNISFTLPSKGFVSLKVFDILGREVATIVSEEMSAGSYSRQWNAATISSGVYFYRLQAGSFTDTKKLILLR